jgi:hypothetical protein
MTVAQIYRRVKRWYKQTSHMRQTFIFISTIQLTWSGVYQTYIHGDRRSIELTVMICQTTNWKFIRSINTQPARAR